MLRAHALAVAAGLAFALVAARAHADDAADARAEYAAGTAALSKNAYREAAEHFEVAARLRPHAAAYFAAGKAWQLAGELVRSADRLSAALERNELSPVDKSDALRRLAGIEEKIGTINVTGDASMEAQLDDGPSVHPTGSRHATPGKHTLFIRGPGGSTSREVTLNAGGALPVQLAPSMLANPSAPAPSTAPPPPPKSDEVDSGGSSGSGLRTVAIVAFAGAGVGAGVSIGLGVAALSAKDKFLKSRKQADFDGANGLETATNVGWAATAVLGTAGAALLTVSIVARPKTAAWLELRPESVSLVGRF